MKTFNFTDEHKQTATAQYLIEAVEQFNVSIGIYGADTVTGRAYAKARDAFIDSVNEELAQEQQATPA